MFMSNSSKGYMLSLKIGSVQLVSVQRVSLITCYYALKFQKKEAKCGMTPGLDGKLILISTMFPMAWNSSKIRCLKMVVEEFSWLVFSVMAWRGWDVSSVLNSRTPIGHHCVWSRPFRVSHWPIPTAHAHSSDSASTLFRNSNQRLKKIDQNRIYLQGTILPISGVTPNCVTVKRDA